MKSKTNKTEKRAGVNGEEEFLKRLREKQKGKLIKITCWTGEDGSKAVTHATSINKAASFVRRHSRFYANWTMEFQSETDPSTNVPEWAALEIRSAWRAAREASGQLEAFRILECMIDRIGYGRTENNPPVYTKKG